MSHLHFIVRSKCGLERCNSFPFDWLETSAHARWCACLSAMSDHLRRSHSSLGLGLHLQFPRGSFYGLWPLSLPLCNSQGFHYNGDRSPYRCRDRCHFPTAVVLAVCTAAVTAVALAAVVAAVYEKLKRFLSKRHHFILALYIYVSMLSRSFLTLKNLFLWLRAFRET